MQHQLVSFSFHPPAQRELILLIAVMALALSPKFDLTLTYFLIAGSTFCHTLSEPTRC